MSVLFMFPGQGSQSPGMLSRLPDSPETAQALSQARAVLDLDPHQLETAAALQSTVAVQLCLLIAGVAMANTLIGKGAAPDMVAGMSVGAYPAAVVAGVLDYADALALVHERGRQMEAAFPHGYGMTAIIGLEQSVIERLLAHVHSQAFPVFLANINAERQHIVAGSDAAMNVFSQRAMAAGATRCERLAVSVPSHCSLLESVAEALQARIASLGLHTPHMTYLSSCAARAMTHPRRIGEDLATNVARPVNWRDTVVLARERGVRLMVEMPARSVLTGLARSLWPDGLVLASDDTRIDTICTWVQRQHG